MRRFVKSVLTPLAVAFAAAGLALIAPAVALADDVVSDARAAGIIGEQANAGDMGLLGVRDAARATPDLRRRIDEINGERRRVYFERAQAASAAPAEMAAAVACQLLAGRVAVGEDYRDEAGVWRQHTASAPVVMPSYCAP